MDNRNIIHIYVIHKNIRHIEDKHGEERKKDYLMYWMLQMVYRYRIDIMVENRNDLVTVYLTDGTGLSVRV